MNFNLISRRVLVIIMILTLIISNVIVNFAETGPGAEMDAVIDNNLTTSKTRQVPEVEKTFMNFSASGCNGTTIDEDGNVILDWAQQVPEQDPDTTLLCHFDDTYEGENTEMPFKYKKK